MKTLKKISYKTFFKKFRQEYGDSLNPAKAKQVAAANGYKIADMHNIVDSAKRDGRLD